ncbi:MAG: hypothetical protein CMP61_01425 [Flavobacteriales bacterium]|nr:hypothetical protein [Flavobacteriales bacterium]|tara:strand:- start:10271 stop:11317 length:1047 start_codon:yes stop_codon:yes gene_type:complete
MGKKEGKFINLKATLSSADNKYKYGSNVKCKLYLEILHDFDINYLNAKVCVEVRGVVNYSPMIVHLEKLSDKDSWMAGDILEYEFDFCPSDMISYQGKYVQFVWYVETDADLTSKSKSFIRKQYLKNLSVSKVFSPEQEFDRKLRFKVFPKTYTYVPSSIKKTIKASLSWWLLLIPLVMFGIGYLMWNFGLLLGSIFVYVFGFFSFGIFGYSSYMKWDIKTFGTIDISSQSIENNQQEVKIKLKKNWSKISSLDCYYEVREWVTDGRGSDRVVYDKVIGRTKYRRIRDVQQKNTFKTQINLTDAPGSFEQDNVEIQWFLMFRANLKNGQKITEELKTNVTLNPYYLAS